jgi:aldehyde:ferredoxin oxidoreductase
MHDPKYAPGYARTYQYDPTPGRHVKGGVAMAQMFGMIGKYDYDTTGYLDVKMTANQELINSAGFCMFMSLAGAEQGIENQYLEAITGRSFKPQDQDATGMRILNMRHAFNLREGITPKDLTLTKRALGQPPQKEGPVAGVEIDDKKLRDNFFAFIGWDVETGKPSKGALEKLGLDFLIKDLY